MTDDQQRPGGLRHHFQRRHGLEGKCVPRSPVGDHHSSHASVVVQEQRAIPSPSLNTDVSTSDNCTLWDEIYDSFNASTTSVERRKIAEDFRDQSRNPQTLSTEYYADEPEHSRHWHTCMQILQAAEAEKNGNKSGAAGPLRRKMKDAYNEIITWVQKFVALGDIISQVDPVHIGLPWAGVRAILVGSTLHPI